MARKLFTLKKTLVLAVTVLAIGGIVWLANRAPREPVYQGKKLSWWFTEGVRQNTSGYGGGLRGVTFPSPPADAGTKPQSP